MIDRIVKEEVIRARLSHLGFDLEKNGSNWVVRDRREKLDLPALQPPRVGTLDTILELFQIEL